MYRIYVFGMDLADIDSIGGWQLYLSTSNKEYANEIFGYLEAGHGENVMRLEPGEVFDDYI